MCRKLTLLVVLVVLQAALVGNAFAASADAWWSGGATTDLWLLTQNWWASGGGTPAFDANAHLDAPLPLVAKINPSTNDPCSLPPGPTGIGVTCYDLYCGDWSVLQLDWATDPNVATLDVNNQVLHVTRNLLIGVRETTYQPIPVQAIGDVNVINGGTIHVGGDLWVGSEGTGILNIGRIGLGDVNVTGTLKCPGGPQPPYQAGDGTYPQRYRWGTGRINLYSGTLKANDIYSEYADIAEINIRAGVLILNGDRTSAISELMNQGKIFAYSHEGNIQCDYNSTTGKTTVAGTRDPNLALAISPTNYGTGLILDANLTWTPGANSPTHDVYFGVNESNVTDANIAIPLGAFKGNQVPALYDPGFTLASVTTYFWRIDEFSGGVRHRGYVWRFTTRDPDLPTNPNPPQNQTNVAADKTFTWTKGASATSHDVYLSTNFADVNTHAVAAYKGNVTITAYNPGELFLGPKTYYWRINEVDSEETEHFGPVWKFSTATYRLIDDFSSYGTGTGTTPPAIGYFWKKSGSSLVTSVAHRYYYGIDRTDSNELFDGNAMFLTYNTTTSPFNSEVNYVPYQGTQIPLTQQNWKLGGVKILGIYVHGEPNNTLEKLYVTVQDFNNHRLKVYYPDSNEMKQQTNEDWIWWVIDLQRFEDAGVQLGKVKNLVIGLGDKATPGGTGRIYFDNIRLYPRWCPTGYNGSLDQSIDADFSGDCIVNITDLGILVDDWLMGSYPVTALQPPDPNVDPNLVLWYRFNQQSGDIIQDSSGNGYNSSTLVCGESCSDIWVTDPIGHDGGGAFTFDGSKVFINVPVAAVSDTNLGGHSTVMFWMKDNGQPEPKMLFQIGSLGNRGNIQVWSGWMGSFQYRCGEDPVTNYYDQAYWGRSAYTNPGHIRNQWNQYAFTKDHNDGVIRIYHNGYAVAEYREAFAEKMPAFRTSGSELDFFTIGAFQWSGTTSAPLGDYYKGSMDDFRLYKRAFTDREILYLYSGATGSITQPVLSTANVARTGTDAGIVNFKDFRIMAARWMDNPLLWP